MQHADRLDKRIRSALWSTRAATLALGLGLATWGMAPAVVFRFTAGEPPPVGLAVMGFLTAVTGGGFVLLAFLLCARRRWALWTAFACALLILAGTIAAHPLGEAAALAVFPLLLSLAVVATSGLALDATRHAREHPDAPAPA